MRRIPSGDRTYMERNARFHLAVYEACGSPLLLSLIRL
ncbi:MAG: FCD domain-containing protein, partial [Acidimicrobiales bacterium]